jgi:hypothetical protein
MEADRGRACSSSTQRPAPFADGPARIDREVDTVPGISTGCQRPRRGTEYETVLYLRRIDREHAAAMYGWQHPANVEWAARRAAARATAYAGVQCFSMEAQR